MHILSYLAGCLVLFWYVFCFSLALLSDDSQRVGLVGLRGHTGGVGSVSVDVVALLASTDG